MKRLFITLLAAVIIAVGVGAKAPRRGYRGFIDWSNNLRSESVWGNGDPRVTNWYTGVSTSHGMQFNPWLFVGVGLDYEHSSERSSDLVTPFLHARTDLRFGPFTPFGEIRLGYNLTQGGGVSFSPAIGYRLSFTGKFGINLGVGMTILSHGGDTYQIVTTPEGYITAIPDGTWRGTKAFFSFRVGFDF